MYYIIHIIYLISYILCLISYILYLISGAGRPAGRTPPHERAKMNTVVLKGIEKETSPFEAAGRPASKEIERK